MISVRDLTKSYGDHPVLHGLTFDIKPGVMTGFVGGNGAGKTTTMRILLGVLSPDSGEVLVDGSPITADHLAGIGYMPEERGLYPRMRVLEQLVYLGQLCGGTSNEVGRIVDRWLGRLGLAARAADRLDSLSHGNQQRVQLIAALVNQPDLLVREETEYGGCLAAEVLGLPHATVGVHAIGEFVRRDLIGEPLAALAAAHGLPPDPDLAMLDRYLTLRPFPPGYRDPARPLAPTA